MTARKPAGVDYLADALTDRIADLAARNVLLEQALRDVLAYVRRVGGYMAPGDQAVLRNAESMLLGKAKP